jgi:hypothetical protein
MDTVPEILCNRCRQMLPITAFSPDARCPLRHGRATYCRDCRRAAYLARLDADPKTRYLVVRRDFFDHMAETVRAIAAGELPVPSILCNRCKAEKPITEYGRNHTLPGRYFRNTYCKPCSVILTQQYQRGDMERYRARLRKHSLKANFGMTPKTTTAYWWHRITSVPFATSQRRSLIHGRGSCAACQWTTTTPRGACGGCYATTVTTASGTSAKTLSCSGLLSHT